MYLFFCFLVTFLIIATGSSITNEYKTLAIYSSNNLFLSQLKQTSISFFLIHKFKTQKSSGTKLIWFKYLSTINDNVGNWHVPKLTNFSNIPLLYLFLINKVWYLVKAAPVLKSISCLASTASLKLGLGLIGLLKAFISSLLSADENFALCIFILLFFSQHISITS